MSQSTTQFITQMKLLELRRQRAKLREAYEDLRRAVAEAGEPGARLRTLHDGLRGLTFAGQPLHPDIVNLEVLLHEVDAGAAPADVVALWVRRLEAELDAGRARSEVVYLFGALLEEWSRGEAAEGPPDEDAEGARDRLLHDATADVQGNAHRDVLDPIFEGLGAGQGELGDRVRKACKEQVERPLGVTELESVLQRLAKDIYRPAGLRREARQFVASRELRKELADALTILLAELPSWQWPEAGLATRALWTRNKWRLYLAEDLPTACLLEVLGQRWIDLFAHLVGDQETQVTQYRARLQKLLDLHAPEVILANERRMLRTAEEMVSLGSSEGADLWDEGDDPPALDPEGRSVVYHRAEHKASLRSFWGASGDYDSEYGEINRAVMLVHAEVQLARTAFPDRPLYLVKLDLKDFYPSIPHDVLLEVLRRLGVPEVHRSFFARYLAPPLQSADAPPSRMKRGVPMGHSLSAMLAELLMRLLERHVQRHARVRIVRIVDDACFLTPNAAAAVMAWQAVESFCAACGLQLNVEKSGSLCLGGERPRELPPGRPRWGMLQLDDNALWDVHPETFEAHLAQARAKVEAARSILSRIQVFNANAKYLLNALALGCRLGDAHRRSSGQAVRRFHQAFFGPERGIVPGLRAEIESQFGAGAGEESAVPLAWLYWPITAGGLGLRNPLVVAAQYAAADRAQQSRPAPIDRPLDWDRRDNDWGAFYGQFLERLEALEPNETKVMKTLLDDFIARGSEITAGQQSGLSSYWRWILCTYGPQILERFGTFRFLITELVPLQLISRQLIQDSSLDGAEPSMSAPER